MRAKRILIVGIALFAASCATMASKQVQGPATPGAAPAQADSGPPGIGSSQQGPSLNGEVNDSQELSIVPDAATASRPDARTTGLNVDAVHLVGGQLFWTAPR